MKSKSIEEIEAFLNSCLPREDFNPFMHSFNGPSLSEKLGSYLKKVTILDCVDLLKKVRVFSVETRPFLKLSVELRAYLKTKTIPLIMRVIQNDSELSEDSLETLRAILWSLPDLIRATHSDLEICNYVAHRMGFTDEETSIHFPHYVGNYYAVLEEPRRLNQEEASEKYWDRYAHLIALHDIGYQPDLLDWRLLILTEAELALAEGRDTDNLDKKPSQSVRTAQSDLSEAIRKHPLSYLRALDRLWKKICFIGPMGPLQVVNKLMPLCEYLASEVFEEAVYLKLADTILDYLPELLVCDLTRPKTSAGVQALFDSYFTIIGCLQSQEKCKKSAQNLCERLLKLLADPQWPQGYTKKNVASNDNIIQILLTQIDVLLKHLTALESKQSLSREVPKLTSRKPSAGDLMLGFIGTASDDTEKKDKSSLHELK